MLRDERAAQEPAPVEDNALMAELPDCQAFVGDARGKQGAGVTQGAFGCLHGHGAAGPQGGGVGALAAQDKVDLKGKQPIGKDGHGQPFAGAGRNFLENAKTSHQAVAML